MEVVIRRLMNTPDGEVFNAPDDEATIAWCVNNHSMGCGFAEYEDGPIYWLGDFKGDGISRYEYDD